MQCNIRESLCQADPNCHFKVQHTILQRERIFQKFWLLSKYNRIVLHCSSTHQNFHQRTSLTLVPQHRKPCISNSCLNGSRTHLKIPSRYQGDDFLKRDNWFSDPSIRCRAKTWPSVKEEITFTSVSRNCSDISTIWWTCSAPPSNSPRRVRSHTIHTTLNSFWAISPTQWVQKRFSNEKPK